MTNSKHKELYQKPQKGKDYGNLPQFALDTFDNDEWLVSIKYDGNCIFIVNDDGTVRFFTSDYKEFNLPKLKGILEAHTINNYKLIGEFMYSSEGKLGDRTKSAILTTARTEFAKGLRVSLDEDLVNIKVFDILSVDSSIPEGILTPFINRHKEASKLIDHLDYNISTVDITIRNGKEAKEYSKRLAKEGWEGVMCIKANSIYASGKRVNYAVKLKHRTTADLLCIDYELAEAGSQFDGLIGSLVLRDSEGRTVSVGSGLTPDDRKKKPEEYLGKIIEINYEQLTDISYIQPSFSCIRHDKSESN